MNPKNNLGFAEDEFQEGEKRKIIFASCENHSCAAKTCQFDVNFFEVSFLFRCYIMKRMKSLTNNQLDSVKNKPRCVGPNFFDHSFHTIATCKIITS